MRMKVHTIEWKDRPHFTKEEIEQILIESLDGENSPPISREEFDRMAQEWFEKSEADWYKDHPQS